MKHTRFVEHLSLVKPPKIDRALGVIRDVKFLGFESLNDRTYEEVDPAIFNGRKSRVNHYAKEDDLNPPDPQVENIWAFTENARLADDGVYGDIKYNPKHPMIEQILWWAENKPDVAGMSPIMYGTQRKVGSRMVRTPKLVESVDLVDRPATTNGFFESRKETRNMDEDLKKALADLAERNATIGTLNVQIESHKANVTKLTSDLTTATARADKAEGTIVAMTESVKQAATTTARNALLTEAGFDLKDKDSEAFFEAVRTSKDDALAASLILTATNGRKPTPTSSRQGHPAGASGNVKLVESLDEADKAGLLTV